LQGGGLYRYAHMKDGDVLVLSLVPEPSSAALVFVAMCTLAARTRPRRRHATSKAHYNQVIRLQVNGCASS
jgi:hypothetical protein